MKRMVLVPTLALLIACPAQQVPLHHLELGMSRNQVEAALGPPAQVVGARSYAESRIEVLQYGHDRNEVFDGRVGAPERAYWLYFLDDVLVEWEPAAGANWSATADRLYQERRQGND